MAQQPTTLYHVTCTSILKTTTHSPPQEEFDLFGTYNSLSAANAAVRADARADLHPHHHHDAFAVYEESTAEDGRLEIHTVDAAGDVYDFGIEVEENPRVAGATKGGDIFVVVESVFDPATGGAAEEGVVGSFLGLVEANERARGLVKEILGVRGEGHGQGQGTWEETEGPDGTVVVKGMEPGGRNWHVEVLRRECAGR
ncbi:MAG: hypothetical protein M1819_007103 [Sarea resinae]|nr:MAG: hypothetical protein M1819_007103 [Sarea resinae]